jgi:hypothetical protein
LFKEEDIISNKNMIFSDVYETWDGKATMAKLLHILNYKTSCLTIEELVDQLELPSDHIFENHATMVRAGMRVSNRFCQDCAAIVAIFATQICKVHGKQTISEDIKPDVMSPDLGLDSDSED